MTGIPAASLLPQAFNAGKPDWIWSPRDIPEDGSRKLFLTSEIVAGWRYYTVNKEIRLSKEFPADYEKDIGYKWNHGPGKTDKDGKPAEEKSKPTGIWLVRAWLVEDERMVAAIIDSFPLQGQIQKALQNDEFLMLDEGVTNFYLTIFHDKNPASPALTYTAQASMRTLRNKKAYKEAGEPFYSENYWKGLNPLDAPAEPPANAGVPAGLPATVRDEHGADHEAVINKEGDYAW
jgi:hypothetical protein